jgi:hypothetical protein
MRRSLRRLHALLAIAAALGSTLSVWSEAKTTTTRTPPQTLRNPITRNQLRRYFVASLLLETTRRQMQEQLAQKQKALPPYFPEAVWQEIKQKVGNLDLVDVALPVYQRYFTEQDGEVIDLMYQGRIGHEYAAATMKSRMDASHRGLEGSAEDRAAEQSVAEAQVSELRNKRYSELTPKQIAAVREFQARTAKTTENGLKVDDEQNIAVQAKWKELVQSTLAVHRADLEAAKQAYEKKTAGK